MHSQHARCVLGTTIGCNLRGVGCPCYSGRLFRFLSEGFRHQLCQRLYRFKYAHYLLITQVDGGDYLRGISMALPDARSSVRVSPGLWILWSLDCSVFGLLGLWIAWSLECFVFVLD